MGVREGSIPGGSVGAWLSDEEIQGVDGGDGWDDGEDQREPEVSLHGTACDQDPVGQVGGYGQHDDPEDSK